MRWALAKGSPSVAATGQQAAPLGADEVAPWSMSIIIPTSLEEENVEPLYEALMALGPDNGTSFEVIFVDDGSRDRTSNGSPPSARDRSGADRQVTAELAGSRHGGGIEHAQGEVLVTMDADLQNDPADIGCLIAKLEEGYDLVVGWRTSGRTSGCRAGCPRA